MLDIRQASLVTTKREMSWAAQDYVGIRADANDRIREVANTIYLLSRQKLGDIYYHDYKKTFYLNVKGAATPEIMKEIKKKIGALDTNETGMKIVPGKSTLGLQSTIVLQLHRLGIAKNLTLSFL